jgi:hypothetical protein
VFIQDTWGYRTNFFLTSQPDLNHGVLAVSIDGQPMPSRDSSGDTAWTYDSVANSVNFEPRFVPAIGSTTEITYTTACF